MRLVVLAVAVAACASPQLAPDARPDGADVADAAAATDARLGAGADAAIDARPDAVVDAQVDAMVDARADAAVDATVDAAPDATVDAQPDAALDAQPDAALDARPDAAPDAGGPIVLAFDTATYDVGIVPSGYVTTALPAIRLTNESSTTQSVELTVDDPFEIVMQCAPIAPGASCTVALQAFPSETGAFAATLTATSATGTAQASLVGTADGYVTYEVSSGPGTLTATPAGEGCNGSCYPGGTVVTLTATPATGYHVAGWTDPSCGTSLTCTEVANEVWQDVQVSFALDQVGFEVDLLGDAIAEAKITSLADGNYRTCTASCTVVIPYGEVVVEVSTPTSIATWSPPCVGSSSECAVPAGTPSVAITASLASDERDLYFTGDVLSVDYDDAGELVVGTTTGVTKLSASLDPIWTVAIPGEARVDRAGNVFVLSTDALHALDAAGNPRWSGGAGVPLPLKPHSGHTFVPTGDGGAVVDRNGHLEIWSAAGTVVATPALGASDEYVDENALALHADGDILAAVNDSALDETDIEVFTPAGARLADLGTPVQARVEGYWGAVAADATGDVAATASGFSHMNVVALDGSGAQRFSDLTTIPDPDFMFNAVALDGGSDVISLRAYSESTLPAEGIHLRVFSPSGVVTRTIDRPGLDDETRGPYGLGPADLTASSAGAFAVGGVYYGIGVREGIVQVFQ